VSGKATYGKFVHWLMPINICLTLIFAKGMSELPDASSMSVTRW
jgi:hypothetical protein